MANLLLIDASNADSSRLASRLQGLGFEVLHVSRQSEIGDALTKGTFDLLLVDPEFAGIELTSITELASESEIPVLLLVSAGSVGGHLDHEASDLLTKPIDPYVLLHKVRYHLAGTDARTGAGVIEVRRAETSGKGNRGGESLAAQALPQH